MNNSLLVVKFLLHNREKSFSVKELSKELHRHTISVYRAVVDPLVLGIIKEEYGKPNKYCFNKDLL